MYGIGFPELLLILIVALLVFGAARLPEIGRAMGKAMREFKKGVQDISDDGEKKDEQSG